MGELEELLAADLDASMASYADGVLARVREELPQLVADRELAALASAGTAAVLREFAVVLRIGLVRGFHAPAQALLFGQMLARAGVPLAQVLRSYRLGQETMFARAAELAAAHALADPAAAIARLGVLSFAFADAMMSDVAAEFEREREAVIRSSFARRDAAIHALLAGAAVDVDAAEQALGHRLRGRHQALVAWRAAGADGDAPDLPELLRAALRDAGAGRPLLLAEGPVVTAWVTPGEGAVDWALVGERLTAAGAQAAVGEVAGGPGGFVRTREQAQLARDVARRDPERRLTHYPDVALAALLTRDGAVARAFAADELRGLGGAASAVGAVRATVAAYFAAGHDQTRAAARLGVHRNTVARRLARAADLLGHDLTTRVREVEAALAVVETLGPPAA